MLMLMMVFGAQDVVSMTLMPSGRLVSCGWDKALKVWNFPVRRE
jgi:hypothetical protein